MHSSLKEIPELESGPLPRYMRPCMDFFQGLAEEIMVTLVASVTSCSNQRSFRFGTDFAANDA